ncbi:hypothetical protein [Pseudomonas oryzae]|uniref:CARDB protein n=1 Tax=Pseudomonas oryzae TaxID=1392877 RepID=A0A1H1RV57_9PSED|nr:hypothetical protein [Pseudomonas oryzae]SDS39545.1 hypothetical protein SAMN05216221_1724 [Pseudomonas oryzae]
MRSPLFKKLPSCLLGAVIAASTATSVPVYAVDGNPPGLFELEGNTVGQGTPGDDWEDLWAGGANTGANSFAFTGIVPDSGAGDTVFFQGGSKDVYDVPNWGYSLGSTPDKNDITNAYAAAYNVAADVCLNNLGAPVLCSAPGAVGNPIHEQGDLIVYFGLDRFANDGDAFAGFWFFQGDIGQTTPNTQGSGNFTGNHVEMRDNPDFGQPGEPEFLPGDMFVIVEYPQGANAQPIIKVYQWDPNDVDGDVNWDPNESAKPPKNLQSPLDLVITETSAKCDGTGDKLACAITNVTTQTNTPAWPYTPKSGPATDLPLESFFEGGINVTKLLGSTPCFASFLAETRSSSSQTAQLKDYVFGAFPVCGIEVAKDCTADLNDNGDGVDVNFFGTLENTGGSGYIAYLKDDQTGASIDDVCIDTNAAGCADDGPVTGLVLQADGSAYFPLPPNTTVRFEGSYSVNSLPSSFTMTDEVMALAFQEVEDVPGPNEDPDLELVVVDDSDDAECSFNVNPALEVIKDCTVAFLNGDSAEVTISGSVENTGDVPLSNVTVVDSDFGSLTFPTTLAVGAKETFSKTVSVAYANLDPSVSDPDDNGKVTVTLNHSDTVTAEGDVLSGTTVLDSAEHSDGATCDDTFTRDIDIQKECDEVVLVPENGKLVVKTKVTVTVSNTGDEDLTVTSLTDDPAVVFDQATPFTLPAGGTPVEIEGYYFPSSPTEISGPLTDLSFPDTASVSATGAFSGATASDSDDADCPLCPPSAQ